MPALGHTPCRVSLPEAHHAALLQGLPRQASQSCLCPYPTTSHNEAAPNLRTLPESSNRAQAPIKRSSCRCRANGPRKHPKLLPRRRTRSTLAFLPLSRLLLCRVSPHAKFVYRHRGMKPYFPYPTWEARTSKALDPIERHPQLPLDRLQTGTTRSGSGHVDVS